MLKGILYGILTRIDTGSRQHATVRKKQYLLVCALSQILQEGGHSPILIGKRLPARCRLVEPIGKLRHGTRIARHVIPTLHLPLTKVHLHQTRICHRLRIATKGGQTTTTRERTAPYLIKSMPLEGLLHTGRLFRESSLQRHIGLPISITCRHVNSCMSNQIYLHNPLR